MIYQLISWLGTFVLLTGVIAIGYKKRWAFLCFLFGEIFILIYSLHIRAWSIAFIGVTFAGLAVRNYILWSLE